MPEPLEIHASKPVHASSGESSAPLPVAQPNYETFNNVKFLKDGSGLVYIAKSGIAFFLDFEKFVWRKMDAELVASFLGGHQEFIMDFLQFTSYFPLPDE